MPREFSELELKARGYFNLDKRMFFIVICVLNFLIVFIQQNFIVAEIAAFQFLEGTEMLLFKAIAGLKLLGIPLMYALKFTVVGFILYTGCFMWGYKVSYAKSWQIAMFAELIFFLPKILKTLWFLFFVGDPTYWDFQAFYPFSIMNFYNHEAVDQRYWYSFQALNIFEIAYWVALTYGVDFAARKKKSVANAIVLTSYIPLFIFWLWFYTAVYD